jgi:hypothetical protein
MTVTMTFRPVLVTDDDWRIGGSDSVSLLKLEGCSGEYEMNRLWEQDSGRSQ